MIFNTTRQVPVWTFTGNILATTWFGLYFAETTGSVNLNYFLPYPYGIGSGQFGAVTLQVSHSKVVSKYQNPLTSLTTTALGFFQTTSTVTAL
ncbi:hypothetical protein SAMD00019534_014800 [Acytostelium subglobosum LB1]|uniref:hypothetical protein n=1 Tax=Acytostelium subglobosum LB1 TaxID=1410327 RepID=UPI000644D7D3|nr:hypothetical protein SAMD00019534_014800 [Acytostelium subglobosum LB1]GAM18305.1 hypothetical protein SAMD00019534_014800 [Acytostelium subglobosum LB1]|eukprot:XP_012757525.1 hypothetical protein SAMD00019534_014800 [Acytostelium subglobosum LB1]